jgi:hypothetical protein
MPAEEVKGLPALCLLTYFLDWTNRYREDLSIDKTIEDSDIITSRHEQHNMHPRQRQTQSVIGDVVSQ